MPSSLAIYPTAHKVEDLLKRQSLKSGCVLGYRLTTFPQVTDALWREANIIGVMVSSIGERLALEDAITQVRARDGQLPFVPEAGVRAHLLRLIHELKSAGIGAGDLDQACATLPSNLARRLTAAAQIFAQYENLLRARGAVDNHDRERLVVEWLHRLERKAQRPRLLNGIEHLLLAEVYDPSLLQFMLVSSLIRIVGDATLTVQAEPFDLRVRRFAELTWNRFVGDESIADKVLPDFIRRGGRQGRLGYVLTHLFRPLSPGLDQQDKTGFASAAGPAPQELERSIEIPPQDGTVRIVEAADPRREAEEAARAIRRMLELPPSEQIALDRIAIVARNIAAYRSHLEAAFAAYRVPLRLYCNQTLLAFAAARLVRDLLRIPLRNYHRDTLLSLCRAPFLKLAAAQYQNMPALTGYIDRATRPLTECINSRRGELVRALDSNPRGAEFETLRHQLTVFDRAAQAWGDLMQTLGQLEPPGTIADFVDRTLFVLDRFRLDPVRDSATDSAAVAAGPLKTAFATLAREAALIVPQRQVTLNEFVSIVEDVLDETRVEPLDEHLAGGVRALSVADARGLDFDCVFIIGLNDGTFPAYRSEDSLIPNEVIQHLNPPLRQALCKRLGSFAPDAPGPILRSHHDRNAQEPFLFFLAMSMPSQSVVLSYSVEDGSGNPLQVSPFVREVRGILKDSQPKRAGSEELIPHVNDCFAADEFLARAALDSVLSQPHVSDLTDAVQIASIIRRTDVERRRAKYLALPTRQELVRQRRRQQNSTGWLAIDLSPDDEKLASASDYNGRIAATPALSRFLLNRSSEDPREWSAAQLTELAACGYKFFARRVLRLRESDEVDHEQTALETGSLVHEILEQIFKLYPSSDPDSLLAAARDVLADFHARKRAEARDPAFFEIGWRTIDAMVNEVIEYEIARRERGEAPTDMVHEFRFSCVLPPTVSGLPSGLEIGLVGQIDRLEIYREAGRIQRLKLVDYKASRRLNDYAERLKPGFFACEDLQMPVYALGAVEHFRNELSAQAAVEVSYIALKNREKETAAEAIPLPLLVRGAETQQKTVATRVLDLVAGAVAGHFDVDPLECSDYCPYRRVCRYRKPVSEA